MENMLENPWSCWPTASSFAFQEALQAPPVSAQLLGALHLLLRAHGAPGTVRFLALGPTNPSWCSTEAQWMLGTKGPNSVWS